MVVAKRVSGVISEVRNRNRAFENVLPFTKCLEREIFSTSGEYSDLHSTKAVIEFIIIIIVSLLFSTAG